MIFVIVEFKGVYEIWQIKLNNIYLNCLKFKTQNFSGDVKMQKFFNEKITTRDISKFLNLLKMMEFIRLLAIVIFIWIITNQQ